MLPCMVSAQALAKQRIALLRAAKAAQQSAQQPGAAASGKQQPSARADAAPGQAAAAPRSAAAQAPAQSPPPEPPATAAAAQKQAAVSSLGTLAARAARQKNNVSASAAWAPAAGTAPAFPPKNPRTRRRVQRSTDTVDAQVSLLRSVFTLSDGPVTGCSPVSWSGRCADDATAPRGESQTTPTSRQQAANSASRCVLHLQRYERVVALRRNRLAAQLSRANRYVTHLEGRTEVLNRQKSRFCCRGTSRWWRRATASRRSSAAPTATSRIWRQNLQGDQQTSAPRLPAWRKSARSCSCCSDGQACLNTH